MRKKIEIIVFGVLVPFILWVGIALFVSLVVKVFNINVTNELIEQSIVNILGLGIFVPYYWKHNHNAERISFSYKIFLYLIPIGFSLCMLCNLIILNLPTYVDNVVSEQVDALVASTNMAVGIVVVAIITAILEEILFRGIMFDAIREVSNIKIAIFVTSLIFAIVHGDLYQGIYAFIAGIFLGYVRYKFSKIIYTICMHMIMNITSMIFINEILTLTTMREKIYVGLICGTIFMLSMIRINKVLKEG